MNTFAELLHELQAIQRIAIIPPFSLTPKEQAEICETEERKIWVRLEKLRVAWAADRWRTLFREPAALTVVSDYLEKEIRKIRFGHNLSRFDLPNTAEQKDGF